MVQIYYVHKPESNVANTVVVVSRTDDDSVEVFDTIAFVVGMNVAVDGDFLVTLVAAPKSNAFCVDFLVMVVLPLIIPGLSILTRLQLSAIFDDDRYQ